MTAGWRRVGALMLAVGAGVLALLAFHSVPAGFLGVLAAAGAGMLGPRAGRSARVTPGGWPLGAALELTDPDHPTPTAAVLSEQALNLAPASH